VDKRPWSSTSFWYYSVSFRLIVHVVVAFLTNKFFHSFKNRLPVISKSAMDNRQLSMETAELWCFTRVFSLAMGDLVSEDNKVWIFYTTLRQIMDIVFAPEV
jgi:hypothetical protein